MEAGRIRIRKAVKKYEGDWPKQISGVLIQKPDGAPQGFAVTLPIAAQNTALSTAPAQASPPLAAVTPKSLWTMLLYAFIGGLILNIMPCVLPVIALKILGFVRLAKDEPRRVRALGLIYAAGVLVSFLAFAIFVIGLKAAGHKAGWGMQFGNPYFIVAMTTLVTLIALNLFGLFEITPGGAVMSAAARVSPKNSAAGAFFNGLLATVLATSCTAPFLGVALGYAFAQSPPVVILMFLTIGFGLAAPYIVLSWHPAWIAFLPKPGAWMERFKIAMGFPMLAAGVWLFSLASTYYGERTWWLGIFLVFAGAAAWVYGEFVQRGSRRRSLALAITAALLVVGYSFAIESGLRWRQPLEETNSDVSPQLSPRGITWQRWSPEAIARARAEGRPVLVDFTAKWCPNCQTVVKPALESASVREKLREINAVALLADYTRFPDAITEELERFERAGVPLVLIYPRHPDEPAIVLPEAFSPGTVLKALDQAAK